MRLLESAEKVLMPLLDTISCTVLPGAFYNREPVPSLYNNVYRSWKRTWGEIFTQAGSPQSLDANNFLRQTMIFVLHQGEDVVGVSTITLFNANAEASFDHPYFKPFPQKLLNEARSRQGAIFSSEYLAVEPAFRKSAAQVSLSEILIGLVVKAAIELEATLLFGTAVRPARVDESCKKFGYQEVGSYEKYGLDCALLCGAYEGLHDHPDRETATWIESFWTSKRNLTSLNLNSTSGAVRIAA